MFMQGQLLQQQKRMLRESWRNLWAVPAGETGYFEVGVQENV